MNWSNLKYLPFILIMLYIVLHPIAREQEWNGYCITRSDVSLSYWDIQGICQRNGFGNTTVFDCYENPNRLAVLSLMLKENNRTDTYDESKHISIIVESDQKDELTLHIKLN